MSNISRRSFLQRGAAAAAAFSIVPGSILGKSHGYVAPTDKLNIAAVGIGGMGNANLKNMEKTENIVALCDIDWKYAKGSFRTHTRMQRNIGTTARCMTRWASPSMPYMVATADHTHAIITADAMTMGKHVYYTETVDSLGL